MPTPTDFESRLKMLTEAHEALVNRPNRVDERWNNGWYRRYVNPVVTAGHVPLDWRYDLNPQTNPRLLERLGVNAALNPGAIFHDGKYKLVVRVEGFDRKSFFGIAESDNGIDSFRFTGEPLDVGEDPGNPETNVYDMRLTAHEDGWIYGVYCVERPDPDAAPGDLSAAIAQCAVARTHDLRTWERLGEVKTSSRQQRNVVLHPDFVDEKYAFYTRPQDSFISAGSGGGIGFGLVEDIVNPVIDDQRVFEPRLYHTIKEVKNGMGGPPIRTSSGWLHVAHGVRECAWGLRYVLYAFLCDINDPAKVIAAPGGYFAAPFTDEFIGDVGNVLFSNGLVEKDGRLLVYYASADTRCHVLETDIDTMLDYVLNTPADPLRSHLCVQQRRELIRRNRRFLG